MRVRRLVALAAVALAVALCFQPAAARVPPAVVPPPTSPASAPTPLFGDWGTIAYANLGLSSSTLEGPALVLGAAELSDFDIGGGRPCHPTAPALAVGGAAHGRRGVLKGRAALGWGSALDGTVGLPCADAGDPSQGVTVGGPAGVGLDGWALRVAHIQASTRLCAAAATGRVVVEDSVLKLYPAAAVPAAADCVDVFTVRDPPAGITSVQYFGNRRVVINYWFRSASWGAGVDMATLNATRTLHSFCGAGRLRLRGALLVGSVLGPGLRVDARGAEVRGRFAVEGLQGQAVVRYEPYEGVGAEGLATATCVP